MLRILPDEYYVIRINKRYVRKFRKLLAAFMIYSLPVISYVLPPGRVHIDLNIFSFSSMFLLLFPLLCALLSHRERNAVPQPDQEICEKITLICVVGQVLSVLLTSVCFGAAWIGSEAVLPVPLLGNFIIGFTALFFGLEVLADGYSDGLIRAFYFYNTSAILSVAVLLSEMAQINQESWLKEVWLKCLIFVGLGAVLSVTAFFLLLYHRHVNRRIQVLGRYA